MDENNRECMSLKYHIILLEILIQMSVARLNSHEIKFQNLSLPKNVQLSLMETGFLEWNEQSSDLAAADHDVMAAQSCIVHQIN